MTTIPPVNDPSGGAGANGTSTSNSSGLNQLDNSQTFLQLLVAQLENQDPTNPTDPTSFMTEIAQLTSVQSQTSLSAEEQTVAADSMMGLSVTGNSSAGTPLQGIVMGVLLSPNGPPNLEIDTGDANHPQEMALTAVTAVSLVQSSGSS
jgi:flagellar basal-body rod modification protein FlgD